MGDILSNGRKPVLVSAFFIPVLGFRTTYIFGYGEPSDMLLNIVGISPFHIATLSTYKP